MACERRWVGRDISRGRLGQMFLDSSSCRSISVSLSLINKKLVSLFKSHLIFPGYIKEVVWVKRETHTGGSPILDCSCILQERHIGRWDTRAVLATSLLSWGIYHDLTISGQTGSCCFLQLGLKCLWGVSLHSSLNREWMRGTLLVAQLPKINIVNINNMIIKWVLISQQYDN